MHSQLKRRTWQVVKPDSGLPAGRLLGRFLLVLISLNVLAAVLETVDAFADQYAGMFEAFATFSVVLLTVEYVLRVWSSTASKEYAGPVTGRLRFASRPYPLVDLLVVVPFYLGALFDVGILSLVRVLWFIRFLQLSRLWRAQRRLGHVARNRSDDLAVAFSIAGTLALFSATLLYIVERSAQPEAFSSIPAALWWSVVTLTTVGYGDVVPVTPLGQLFGALTTLGGIAIFALPSSILAAGFLEESESTGQSISDDVTCPECGHVFDSADEKST